MAPKVQDGEPHRLNDRDLFLVRTILRANAQWVVTTHNAHVVSVQPVGKALHAASIPAWWIHYAKANDLELNL